MKQIFLGLLAVGLGSGIGAVTRYFCSLVSVKLFSSTLPWDTFVVNILGAFLIGLYATLVEPGGMLKHSLPTRQFMLIGFCGGFTTFSIFSLDILHLVKQGDTALALFYALFSVIAWLIIVWSGYQFGSWLNRVNHT